MGDVVVGTGQDGVDVLTGDLVARFLLKLRDRQEATWAVVAHGKVVVETWQEKVITCGIYLPKTYKPWWDQNQSACERTLRLAAESAWAVDWDRFKYHLSVEWLLDIPADLEHFVSQNTDRPMPRRYNTTAVQLHERDGVAWLTFPEAKLYDVLKQANWLFVPQPSFLAGEEMDKRVDFLIFWQNRAAWSVIVEVDSDAFHRPSARTHDEAREREFQSRGFHFLRFSAKEVIANPTSVLNEIARFCSMRFGS